jgi:nitrate/TMAO reductase-like tetraheme cytochrome c subunit
MKKFVLPLLSCLAVAVLATAVWAAPVGIGRDKTLAAQPKANSIAELAARYDSKSCVDCHQQAHDEWAKSLHARSIFGTGRTAATFKTAIINGAMEWPASGVKSMKDVKVEHMMGCAKCHLPQLADATDKVAQEIMTTIETWQTALRNDDEDKAAKAEKTLSSLNINCLICHNRNAITHKWTDGYPAKDTVYGAKTGEHMDPKFTKMAKGQVMSESIMCGQCHGVGPNFDLENPTQCATAYGSYLFAYVPEGGNKTCQQCHMTDSKLGHNMQSYRSKVMADKAVEMHVETSSVYWRDNTTIRPKAAVRIELTNKAGHGIPDG